MNKWWAVAVFGLFLVFGAAIGPACGKYKHYVFERDVIGRLKRAADANTVNIAKKELTDVILYLESCGITSGNTSMVWATPNNDVGFWYENLKASLNELETISEDADKVEKTNTLMKLRETLLDGTEVTQPEYIEYYPHVIFWKILTNCSLIIGIIGIFLMVSGVFFGKNRR